MRHRTGQQCLSSTRRSIQQHSLQDMEVYPFIQWNPSSMLSWRFFSKASKQKLFTKRSYAMSQWYDQPLVFYRLGLGDAQRFKDLGMFDGKLDDFLDLLKSSNRQLHRKSQSDSTIQLEKCCYIANRFCATSPIPWAFWLILFALTFH